MKDIFLLVCIFLILCHCNILPQSTKNEITRPSSIQESNQELKNRQIRQLSKSSEDKQKDSLSHSAKFHENRIKPACDLSARSQKKISSYMISDVNSFLNETDIENLLDMHLDDMKQGWPNKCPKHCKAINDYSIFAKTYPLSVNKNSCDKNEAKEIYRLNKNFPMKGHSKSDKQQAHKETRDWMFSIFVNPFYPFAKNPPKEFTENNLDKACPSCSFYLDYTYKYIDNQLDLKVTARCGDKKTFFSKFRSEFFLVNHWKCEGKMKAKDLK